MNRAQSRSGRIAPTRLAGPYAGRRAALATMHGKEIAIAPALRDRLGLAVEVAPGIDTDALGTFTGEVPRAGTMRDAAIAKARLGMAAAGLAIGIASEGSYGPHPQLPFVAGGIELMVLVDADRGIVIAEHLIDDAPVFDHAVTRDLAAIENFLRRVRFPDHALVARANASDGDNTPVHKGLRSTAALVGAIAECAAKSRDGETFLQTDMRAHMNPTRMSTLVRLAARLADRVTSSCPACGCPGYGQIDVETGLPCEWCGTPSIMVRYFVFGCVGCTHRERRPRTDGRAHADPDRCPECNP
jgi:hypothetical protein